MALQLRGVIPPILTPFDDREELDLDALRKQTRFHLEEGVHGICVAGSTGEGHTLTAEESALAARVVVEEVSGQVPVVAGIIRDSTREVLGYARALKEAGVDALQITPVHYVFTPDPDETFNYYRDIVEAVQMPTVIYNVVPWAKIDVPTLYRLLQDLDSVVAVKQSARDLPALAELVRLKPTGGTIINAVDSLLYPAYAIGADGAIAATLAVAPGLCVQQWDAVQRGDHKTALALHDRLLGIWLAIDGPNMPARIKEALAMLGRPCGQARAPMSHVTDDERNGIRTALVNAGLL
jgi:4-hydroxy-tetrahydrodipicolinate synthase